MRYDITRAVAPYVGVSYDTKVGQAALDAADMASRKHSKLWLSDMVLMDC